MINYTLKNCINIAKKLTKNYAKKHKGRNKLEKECIEKGYLVKKLGDVFKDTIESEKDKLALIALDFNTFTRKGGFIVIR